MLELRRISKSDSLISKRLYMFIAKKVFYFLQFPETRKLFEIFKQNNIDARFVGGCVRDTLLSIYTNDYDIAVNAPIENIVKILKEANIKIVETGIKYGSIKVILGKREFDVTSLRCDIECFGRDCKTANISNFEDDAKRRDFTINAIYVSIDGQIFDYFNGISDIKKQRVKFIGDAHSRILEDHLRILRYYRFCGLVSDYSNAYSNILTKDAHYLTKISPERIRKEIFKIIKYDRIIEMMYFDGTLYTLADEDESNLHIERFRRVKSIQNNVENIEILRLYILFSYNILHKKFTLTRDENKRIKMYQQFEFESLEYCYYKHGLNFANEIMILKYSTSGDVKNLNYVFNDIGVFPLTYHDLPLNTANASKRLKECERWWVNNNGAKTKNECLDYIINYPDEINAS